LKQIMQLMAIACSLVAAVSIAIGAMAQDISPALDQAAREAMAQTGAKGLAIAVIDNGQVSAVRAYGVRNARGEPLAPDTVM